MLMLLSACASSMPETPAARSDYQDISVHTPGTTGAHCFLQAAAASYPLSTPGTVTVRKSTRPIDVVCFKGEHMVGSRRIAPVCPNNCNYPSSVSVALALDSASFERKVTHFQHSYR